MAAEKIERVYTIPLRREWLKAPKYKRAKRAISAMRTFLVRHMKSEDIRIGTSVNIEMWRNGIKCPPGKIKVNVTKDDKGVVVAELFGSKDAKAPMKDKRADAKAVRDGPKAPAKTESVKPAVPKTETPKVAPKVEAKKPEVKKV